MDFMPQRFGRGTGSMEACIRHIYKTSENSKLEQEMGAGLGSMNFEEALECPVCWESFDNRDISPYVLWCGHSLCKHCVLNLEGAVVKLSGLPLRLPHFICCPWCQFLTIRFKWKGQLRYPCKNFFLLWVVESLQGDHCQASQSSEDTESSRSVGLAALVISRANNLGLGVTQRQPGIMVPVNSRWSSIDWRRSGTRVMSSVLQFMARIPLVLLLLFIVVYVLPFSILILALYFIGTVLFAAPSFLVVYLSYPSLDWLVRAIVS